MRLRSIGRISALIAGVLAGELTAEAQQTGKVYRIGYIRSGSGLSPSLPPTRDYGKDCVGLGMLKDRTFLLNSVPQNVSANDMLR